MCVSVPCLLLGHGRRPWENRVGTVGLGCASPYRGELLLGCMGLQLLSPKECFWSGARERLQPRGQAQQEE